MSKVSQLAEISTSTIFRTKSNGRISGSGRSSLHIAQPATAFLTSYDASFITVSDLLVDGGYLAKYKRRCKNPLPGHGAAKRPPT